MDNVLECPFCGRDDVPEDNPTCCGEVLPVASPDVSRTVRALILDTTPQSRRMAA